MSLRSLFLNAYDLYLKTTKSKSALAINTLILLLLYAITSNYVVCLTSSKLLFCVISTAAIQNFYYCVEKEVNLDAGKYSLTWVNLCFIFVSFFYFYINNNLIFFISINIFFYVKMIKTWTQLITKISIAKNVFIVGCVFYLYQFRFSWTSFAILFLGIPISFAVWASQIYKYENLPIMNHYLFFNLMFALPVFFVLTNSSPDFIFTWSDFLYTLFVILLGSIAVNFALKFILVNELKHILFVVNEFSVVYIAFCINNWLIFLISLAVCGFCMNLVDFNFMDSFVDPENEQLAAIELTSVEFKNERLLEKDTTENTVKMH